MIVYKKPENPFSSISGTDSKATVLENIVTVWCKHQDSIPFRTFCRRLVWLKNADESNWSYRFKKFIAWAGDEIIEDDLNLDVVKATPFQDSTTRKFMALREAGFKQVKVNVIPASETKAGQVIVSEPFLAYPGKVVTVNQAEQVAHLFESFHLHIWVTWRNKPWRILCFWPDDFTLTLHNGVVDVVNTLDHFFPQVSPCE
jgi:hypothetical protein